MFTTPSIKRPGRQDRRLGRRVGTLVVLLLVVAGGAVAGLRELLLRTGRTPLELLDHVDQRLIGHPKLEFMAAPLLQLTRDWLHAPAAADRTHWPMPIPAPPPRRGADAVLAPERNPPGARVWHVGPNGPLLRIADAARQAGDGDVVEIEAGDYHRDVAVWPQRRLTIRGVGGAARLLAEGTVAEGKAIWVLQNGHFDISNIDFVGAKAEDLNGAGIRFEGGRLRLRNCLFWGNEMGLLTGGQTTMRNAQLIIEDSEFAYSAVAGRWGHNIYVGSIDELVVKGSYSHHAGVGHLLKSRARRNQILYNRLTDEEGGRASYELEFPNGGEAVVIGNIVQQQAGTENGTMIAFGLEGYRWPTNRLTVASNTLVNDLPWGGAFIRVADGADQVVASNNLLSGTGRFLVNGPLVAEANPHVDWSAFARPSRYDYRLRGPGPELAYRPASDPAQEQFLRPRSEYRHRASPTPLTAAPRWAGAVQGLAD